MILADTSVWIGHLARGDGRLQSQLEAGYIGMHPFVIGELACGTLRNRREVLYLLSRLPRLPVASDDETLRLVERRSLMGRGIGWVDAHLVASALIAGASVWTLDRRLVAVAQELGLLHA